ncbi:hypothetical protein NKH77_25530 [Streptomyces sp. M19]
MAALIACASAVRRRPPRRRARPRPAAAGRAVSRAGAAARGRGLGRDRRPQSGETAAAAAGAAAITMVIACALLGPWIARARCGCWACRCAGSAASVVPRRRERHRRREPPGSGHHPDRPGHGVRRRAALRRYDGRAHRRRPGPPGGPRRPRGARGRRVPGRRAAARAAAAGVAAATGSRTARWSSPGATWARPCWTGCRCSASPAAAGPHARPGRTGREPGRSAARHRRRRRRPAHDLGVRPGSTVTLRFDDGVRARLRVVATYDRALALGDFLLARDELLRHTSARPRAASWSPPRRAGPRGPRAGVGGGGAVRARGARPTPVRAAAEDEALARTVTLAVVAAVGGYTVIAVLSTLALITVGRRPELRLLRLAGTGAANCAACSAWRRRPPRRRAWRWARRWPAYRWSRSAWRPRARCRISRRCTPRRSSGWSR